MEIYSPTIIQRKRISQRCTSNLTCFNCSWKNAAENGNTNIHKLFEEKHFGEGKMKNWKNGRWKMHQRHPLETWLHQALISINAAWKIKWFCGYGRLNKVFRNIRLKISCLFYTKQHKTCFSYFLTNFLLQHRRMTSMFLMFAHHSTSLSHRLHKYTYPAFISFRSAKWKQKFALKIFSVSSLFPLLNLRREVSGRRQFRKSHNGTANQVLRKSLQLVC